MVHRHQLEALSRDAQFDEVVGAWEAAVNRDRPVGRRWVAAPEIT